MVYVDEQRWGDCCRKAIFKDYLANCRAFDPVGFDRAMAQDELSRSFEFRSVIIESFLEDARQQH